MSEWCSKRLEQAYMLLDNERSEMRNSERIKFIIGEVMDAIESADVILTEARKYE